MDLSYICSWTSYISIEEHTYSEGDYLEEKERGLGARSKTIKDENTNFKKAQVTIHNTTDKQWS